MTELAGPQISRARMKDAPEDILNRDRTGITHDDTPSMPILVPETQATRQLVEEVIESHRQEDERHFLQLSFQAFENLLAPIQADMLGTLEQALLQRNQTIEVELEDTRSRLERVEKYVSDCFDKDERLQIVPGTSTTTRSVHDTDVAVSPCFGQNSEGGLHTLRMQVNSLDDSHRAQMEQIEQLISSRFVVAQQISELAEQIGHQFAKLEQGHLDDAKAERLNAKVQELTTKIATHEQLARTTSADLQGLSAMIGDHEQKVEQALAARPLASGKADSLSTEDLRDLKVFTLEREVDSLRATALTEVAARGMQMELEKHIIECHRRLDEETARLGKHIELVRRDAVDMQKGFLDSPPHMEIPMHQHQRRAETNVVEFPSGVPGDTPPLARRYSSMSGRPPAEEPSNCRQA